MLCQKCGTENDNKASYCQRCGAALAGADRQRRMTPWTGIAGASFAVILLTAAVAILFHLLQPAPPVIPVPATPPASTALTASFLAPTVAEPTTPANISPTSILALGTSNLYIEYILDASNSMNDALPDGTVKRTVAEKLLADHLRAFRPETNIGLRAFGHRVGSAKEESCQDIEQVAPVEKGQVERIVSWLRDVQPQGWTPLAETIRMTMGDFVFDPARINAVVLLSDGEESCGGDPCRLVEELKAQGINFTIHVIGLNVDEPTRQQLTCIAREAGGTYHDAASEQDLAQALGDVRGDVSVGELVIPAGIHTPTPVLPTGTPAASTNNVGRIAFTSTREGRTGQLWVCTMNPDGTGQTCLIEKAFDPSWSPDGSRIAFASYREGDGDIYVMNSDGSGLTNLTDHPARDSNPAWSPDGTKIAFESWRDGNLEIYVMRSDGSGQTRLTDNPATDAWPTWAPDSQRILFASDRSTFQKAGTYYPREIYTINADGSGASKLTQPASDNWIAAWSPDGTHIAFASIPFNAGGGSDIYIMKPDGSDVTRLTYMRNATYPCWSPNTQYIVFSSAGDIYTVNADGSGARNLTDSPAWDDKPSWSLR